MKKLLFSLLIFAMLLQTACTSTEQETYQDVNEVLVYRPLSEEFWNEGELISTENIVLGRDEDVLDGVMKAMEENPKSPELERSIPLDVNILSYTLKDGELALEMSEEYYQLEGFVQTITNYCITLSLCSLDGVEVVSILVDGEPQSMGLSMEDVLLFDTDKNPYERQLHLFFGDSGGRYLVSEYHSITTSNDVSLERYVIDELLKGPNNTKYNSVIPEGTRLLSINTEDRVCTVNFSDELYYGRPETVIGERLTIYSIVNSLTSLSSVDKVRILINGESLNIYKYMSLIEPIERNEEIISPPSSAKGEIDLNLYMAVSHGLRLAAVPRKITRNEKMKIEMTALQALIDADSEPGYSGLFFKDDVIVSAETEDKICTVALTQNFFDRRSNKNEVYMAISAMVATLTDLSGIEAVKFQIDDGPVTYEGLNLTGVFIRNKGIILS